MGQGDFGRRVWTKGDGTPAPHSPGGRLPGQTLPLPSPCCGLGGGFTTWLQRPKSPHLPEGNSIRHIEGVEDAVRPGASAPMGLAGCGYQLARIISSVVVTTLPLPVSEITAFSGFRLFCDGDTV